MAKQLKKQARTNEAIVANVSTHPPATREERVERTLLQVRATAGKVQVALLELAVDCLDTYFGGDAAAALGDRYVIRSGWSLLLKRLREDSYGISAAQLWFAVRVLAADKLLEDVEEWLGLDPKKKELLLTLRTPRHLADAARHVAKQNLTVEQVRVWLQGRRKELGATPRRRGRKLGAFIGRLDVLTRTLDDGAFEELESQLGTASAADRKKAIARLDEAVERLSRLQKRVGKGRGGRR